VFCGTDITELEASRHELVRVVNELRASNGDLEQFVRIASHDLREPLNTIAQFCDVISQTKGHEFDETTKRYFGLVRGGASRMRTLLDDVLRFVRIGAGDSSSRSDVDLDAVVAEVTQGLQAQLEACGAKLHIGPLGTVHGHRSLISLAVQNLISNAIKFVPAERHPELQIGAVRAAGELRLTIADNGIGIEAARIRELGLPFRRLHARRRFEGTGLGLAICKRIAEQIGGRLEIDSILGEGSRFHLLLPTFDAPRDKRSSSA
jgi:two-component system, sensor histidine kinase and response regulator